MVFSFGHDLVILGMVFSFACHLGMVLSFGYGLFICFSI